MGEVESSLPGLPGFGFHPHLFGWFLLGFQSAFVGAFAAAVSGLDGFQFVRTGGVFLLYLELFCNHIPVHNIDFIVQLISQAVASPVRFLFVCSDGFAYRLSKYFSIDC